jgi:ribose transport system substrate-binding protein
MIRSQLHNLGRRRLTWVALAAASALVLAACSNSSSSSSASASASNSAKTYRIAFLASSSQNGYNQAVYAGITQRAKAMGNVQTTILDGQFKADVQLNQMEDASASGKYDGIIIVPSDTVGIAVGVAAAKAKNIPVATALFPIGPDLKSLQPQVPGIISTIASPPAEGATKQAQLVVDYCKAINPCKVVILIGQLQYPFDKVRYDAFRAVLATAKNIKVVATASGNYDRDTSLKAMTDVLQANPKINVVLSNADQQTEGAQIALKAAGYDLSKIYLTGAGGTKEAVAAVRAGQWKAAYLNFPVSMGAAALDQIINSLTGKPVTAVVNADTIGPIQPFVDKAILDANPAFTGQWSG